MTEIAVKKWELFLKRIWPFRLVPFVDFVCAAGSLATGNMREESDFDVLIGVRTGRIFTVRFFCWLLFGMFGWRRGKHDVHVTASDKICLNHFITPAAYRLAPPYNEYWKRLYSMLVPVYGSCEKIQPFFNANADWLGEQRTCSADYRRNYEKPILAVRFFEAICSGWLGNVLESTLKSIQLRHIKKSETSGYKPRIIVNDNELEFHPDTRRIELYCAEKETPNT